MGKIPASRSAFLNRRTSSLRGGAISIETLDAIIRADKRKQAERQKAKAADNGKKNGKTQKPATVKKVRAEDIHASAAKFLKRNGWLLPYFTALAQSGVSVSAIERTDTFLSRDFVCVTMAPAAITKGEEIEPSPCTLTVHFSPFGSYTIRPIGTVDAASRALSLKLGEHLAPVYVRKLAHPTVRRSPSTANASAQPA